ncbi:Xyloglucan endotransglucosylase/hydrolase protein 9 [Cucurbita argyrosperma subsp. argyrosperma]|nr:Xyloglucan endotransglucosylase/hydrolase protein 9 [Cucurbita argyrosperma subsp. argyrosperma]
MAASVSFACVLGFFLCSLMAGSIESRNFHDLFQPSWAFDHFIYEGELLKLRLDNSSGAGFSSKNKYLFGKVTIQIKLIAGDSAGTVTAFYCSSDGEKKYWWDEPTMSELNLHQSHQLVWVRARHMVYDYCTDSARFPVTPAECVHHTHRHW